jgi:hypothetical protein
MDDQAAAALERQLLELEVLQAMYAEDELSVDGEAELRARAALSGDLPLDELRPLSLAVNATIAGGERAALRITLPPDYPAEPPTLELSCACLDRAAHAAVCAALAAVAAEAAGADREMLADLCLALQHEVDAQRQPQQPSRPPSTTTTTPAQPQHGTRLIWFHHSELRTIETQRACRDTQRRSDGHAFATAVAQSNLSRSARRL